MTLTRRTLFGALSASAALAQRRQFANWKPKLGILCRYSKSNIEFAKEDGFTSLQLNVGGQLPHDAGDNVIAEVKGQIDRSGLYVSSLMMVVNHIDPDPAKRAAGNSDFAKCIELAGKMRIPYVATMSGKNANIGFDKQIDDIVRVYNEKYIPLCQKHNVKIIWEPWPEGPNVATGPEGYEALFTAFKDSPYVGLLYDPSHLVRQFMDPMQCARDFVDKIWDVHLKDVEIMWHVLRKVGIHPFRNVSWWRYRLPGHGQLNWAEFFTILQEAGYKGAMNIEHEDAFYYPAYEGDDFTPQYKEGFRVTHKFLRQFVPA